MGFRVYESGAGKHDNHSRKKSYCSITHAKFSLLKFNRDWLQIEGLLLVRGDTKG